MPNSKIYASPESDLSGTTKIDREMVSSVASRQRALLLLVLGQFLLNPLGKVLEGQGEVGLIFFWLLSIALLILIAVTAIRLSLRLNHIAITAILGVLSVVPLINLIVLLILSRQSTKVLKAAGIRVGLLGASSKDVGK
ncbi:hypothetical protein, partial [Zooshikella harenae]